MALAGGLALAAALFLAPGAAQAAIDCGALNAGNSFTENCPDQTYTGIVYWDQGNAVTLTVPGHASGTTITAGANSGFHNGFTIRTSMHASEARNIALTVGDSTGGTVAIVQESSPQANFWYRNRGILISPRNGNGSTITVNVGSDVTIGTATDKMNSLGIDVAATHANLATGGAISVTSAATIYSEEDGIGVGSIGIGAVTVTNSGAITTDERGIYVNAIGSAGAVTIANSGAITSASTSAHEGIFAKTINKDAANTVAGVSITHSAGAISVAAGGVGIKAHVGAARQEDDMDHANYVAPMNTGLARVAVTGGSVTSKGAAIQAANYEAGSVEVTTSAGVTLTSSEGHGIDATLTDMGNTAGTITVTNAATIAAGTTTMATRHGIFVKRAAGTGVVSVTNSGAITASGRGIHVEGQGGAVTVTNSGAIGTAEDPIARGIHVEARGGAITVANSGAITAAAEHSGIAARQKGSTGAITVTNRGAGAIVAGQIGILAHNADNTTGDVTISVTGGSITAQGKHRNAVEARQTGIGDAVVMVSSGATLTSKYNAGVHAGLRLATAANKDGQIKITQGGTIAGRTGVYTHVERASVVTIAAGTTTYEMRAAADQPVIDVTWTGSFSHGTTATVAGNDNDRYAPDDMAEAITIARGVEAGEATRYGTPAGIEAHVLSWNDVMAQVAMGDDPGAFADAAAVTALFDDSADAATQAQAAVIIAAFKAVLEHDALAAIPGADAIDGDSDGTTTDEEIETWLSEDDADRRTLLRNVLAQSFSDEEMDVLEAVVTNTGLAAALDDEDAGFSNDYKMAVQALLDRHNVGNIRVAMNGGSIAASRGDGIRAYYTTPNAMNGEIDVTIAAGATVSGGMAGIYVANAGAMVTGAERILKQTVTVNGMVTGGSDAAVHLSGGGRLTVGEMGKVYAGPSGRAILVNDPGRSVIVINGEVRGGLADGTAAVETDGGGTITLGQTGRVVLPDGAPNAIRANGADTSVILLVPDLYRDSAEKARDRLGGRDGGGAVVGDSAVDIAVVDEDGITGMMKRDVLLGSDGRLDIDGADFDERPPPPTPPTPTPPPTGEMDCDMASDNRCRLYEALPSVLLAMNDLPTYAERMSAARDGKGGWAQAELARGEWKADSSTRPNVAYDHRRYGVRAGMDFAAGEAGRVGVSVHGLRGSAEMTQSGGEVELSGGGLGVNATAAVAGDVHVDAQAAVTWYDVDLESSLRSSLKKDARGMGYALGVEVGRRMPVRGGVSVTPRGGLLWSKVSLDDFTDSRGGGTRVSVDDADSLVGRVGVMMDAAVGSEDAPGRVFGSVDVEHEFKDETRVDLPGTSLETTARSSGVRLGLGGELAMREGVVLRIRADYTRSGGDTNEYGGGVELNLRF